MSNSSIPAWELIYNGFDAQEVLQEHQAAMAGLSLSPSDTPEIADDGAVAPKTSGKTTIDIPNNGTASGPKSRQPHHGPSEQCQASFDEQAIPYSETRLGQLPAEIKNEIFGLLFGFEDPRMDTTIPHAKRGRLRLWFSRLNEVFREPFATYLLVSKDFRAEGMDHLMTVITFYNRNGDSARNLPVVFGEEATASIQKFELQAHFINKTRDESTWPFLLDLLNAKMPNLKRFTFVSDYLSDSVPYPESEVRDPDGSVTRDQQERRWLLRFGAFVTLRHQNLKVMVLEAASGTRYTDEYRSITRIDLYTPGVQRRLSAATQTLPPASLPVRTDMVMNSTAIRRLKWTELAKVDPATLALEATANSSEVPAADDYYRWVDAKGYLLFAEPRRQGLGGHQKVDNLIDNARRDETHASNPSAPRGRGGRRGRHWRGAMAGGRGRGQGTGPRNGGGAGPIVENNAGRGRGWGRGTGRGGTAGW